MNPLEQRVTGSGGIGLRVREWGKKSAPTVVLIHGYPDDSDVWGPVVQRLRDRFHVVTYDVRGAGRSDAGSGRRDYRLEHLVGDLVAVLDATTEPGEKVHLVGHDWGSVQGWAAVLRDDTAGRIASYTAFGAPALDHAAHGMRRRWRARPRGLAAVAGQLARSGSYMTLMLIPGLVPALWRLGLARGWPAVLRTLERTRPDPAWTVAAQVRNGRYGIGMYRANIWAGLALPGPGSTDLPVQMIVSTRDRFMSSWIFDEAAARVPNLRRRELAAGHWVQLTHPDAVAGYIAEFVDHVESGDDRSSTSPTPARHERTL